MITPEVRIEEARAAYTAAMSRQNANEARMAEAQATISEAETVISDCWAMETALAEKVASTAEEYLKATREANDVAVKALDDKFETASGHRFMDDTPRTFGEGWDTAKAGAGASAAIIEDRSATHEALRAVERVMPEGKID